MSREEELIRELRAEAAKWRNKSNRQRKAYRALQLRFNERERFLSEMWTIRKRNQELYEDNKELKKQLEDLQYRNRKKKRRILFDFLRLW